MVLDFTLPNVTVELVIKRLRYQKKHRQQNWNGYKNLWSWSSPCHLLASHFSNMCQCHVYYISYVFFLPGYIFATGVMSNALSHQVTCVLKKFCDWFCRTQVWTFFFKFCIVALLSHGGVGQGHFLQDTNVILVTSAPPLSARMSFHVVAFWTTCAKYLTRFRLSGDL